jgi:adenine-specific DNA-methyltransferase
MLNYLDGLEGVPGFITQTYCEESRFFQPKNGARIDAIRPEIEVVAAGDPLLRAVLLTSLMLAADRVDSTTGVQMAYLKKWAPRASKDLELRYPPLLPGAGRAYLSDVAERVRDAKVDLLYLDPPYNQHAYLSNYHIWETLVRADQPEVYGIAKKRVDCRTRKSPFNQKRNARQAFQTMVEGITTDHVMLSFNNEGVFNVDELTELLSPLGDVTVLWKPHKRYIGARIGIYNPKGEKVGKVSHTKNLEFLLIASRNSALHARLGDQFVKSLDPAV